MTSNNTNIQKNGPVSTDIPKKYTQNLGPADAARILNTGNIVTTCNIRFSGALDTRNLEKPLDDGDVYEQKENIAALNPDKDPADLFTMKRWDIAEFNRPHLPVIIGKLTNESGFSAQKELRLLDMAIYMPAQGWAIPVELSQFQETIEMAVKHERLLNPEIDDYYVYITVDQKKVPPAKTQRRPGYHSDAYETSETDDDLTNKNADNTYIIYDAIPTHFQAGPFPLAGNVDPEDCDSVLKYFDRLSEGKPPVHFSNHTMVKLTPYDVHSPALNDTGDFVDRTFVKITFSKKPYNLLGNYINNTPDGTGKPILDYTGWDWVPRDPIARNHRNKVTNWHRLDRDQFLEISTTDFNFNNGFAGVDWTMGNVFWAARTEPSYAESALPGEALFTKHDNFNITYNIAQPNNVRITTMHGDQYYLNDTEFKNRYHDQKTPEGYYLPTGKPQPMIEISRDICLRAPWGAMQYLSAGSVLTQNDQGQVYGIYRANRSAYQTANAPSTHNLETTSKCTL